MVADGPSDLSGALLAQLVILVAVIARRVRKTKRCRGKGGADLDFFAEEDTESSVHDERMDQTRMLATLEAFARPESEGPVG